MKTTKQIKRSKMLKKNVRKDKIKNKNKKHIRRRKMREKKGITLISLVITIIILIILAGSSIHTLIGENEIITKAKEAKQNITLAGEAEALQLNQLYYELEMKGELTEDEESAKKDEIIALLQKQVEELQNQVSSLQTENEDLKTQIANLNTQIEELQTELESLRKQISQKDIEIADLKTQINEKQEQINNLQSQLDSLNSLLSQTNATADNILSGYKAYSRGQLLTGTMVNRGAINSSLNCGQSYAIPAGYHNGSGKVTANSLASQTQATATADNISEGKTAWVNGNLITGTGVDNKNSSTLSSLAMLQGGTSWTSFNIEGKTHLSFTVDAYNPYYAPNADGSNEYDYLELKNEKFGGDKLVLYTARNKYVDASQYLSSCTSGWITFYCHVGSSNDGRVYVYDIDLH